MYSYPKRKTYKYIIPTIKGDCVLQLRQATANETNDYIEILNMIANDNLEVRIKGITLKEKYINNLIRSSYKVKRYEFKKKYKLKLVINNIDNYIKDILELIHVSRNSIYEGTSSPKINGKKGRSNRFDGINDLIYKSTGIPIDQIEDRLTREQIGRYIDKQIFNNYESFKEGKAINDFVFSKQGLSPEQQKDLELIKKHLPAKK